MSKTLQTSGRALVDAGNYMQWRYDQICADVGKTVLEIGCGLGNITQFLVQDADFVYATDIVREAVEHTRTRFSDCTNLVAECRDVFKSGLGIYEDRKFDTIVLSDVLEHIEDDLNTMRFCHDVLSKTNGKLLLLVPAHHFLYGTLDKESGHYVRYSKKDILYLADKSGFKVGDVHVFNAIGAAGWWLNYCLLKRKGSHSEGADAQMGLFDKYLVKPSRWLESRVRIPVGLTYSATMGVA